uniref:Uncharacterized protein n=1 Tax=Arion vulgaris TaxID=1028688 RepID=A0A0B7BB97_9EUPU
MAVAVKTSEGVVIDTDGSEVLLGPSLQAHDRKIKETNSAFNMTSNMIMRILAVNKALLWLESQNVCAF